MTCFNYVAVSATSRYLKMKCKVSINMEIKTGKILYRAVKSIRKLILKKYICDLMDLSKSAASAEDNSAHGVFF